MTNRISALLLSASMVALANAARADVSVSNKPTANMSCDAGVCTATAQKAVLNVTDLANMLSTGDVAVKTGSIAKDIDIDQPLQWTSTSRLTLDAQQSVTVKKQITVAGTGALTITTNDSGGVKAKTQTGEFIIVPEHGSVQFWDLGSSLMIDGNSYTLVGDIKTLAADIAANPSGFYALAKPYDASVDGVYAEAPIGTLFKGVLEGAGNDVISLSVASDTNAALVGFFTALGPSAVVRHFGISRANIQAHGANGIGILAGNNLGRIVRSWASGQISFSSSVGAGGLVSENDGTITNSYADVRINGSYLRKDVGGLVDFNDGMIASSYALHSLVLRNTSETNVGGLVGDSSGTIQNSFARNRVNDGKKNDLSNYGGLLGKNEASGEIRSTYAAGQMSQHSQIWLGGLVGYDDAAAGNIRNSYWDLDFGVGDPSQGAGNISNDPGTTGLTTVQFQSGLPEGLDPKTWGQNAKINDGFPYLLSIPPE